MSEGITSNQLEEGVVTVLSKTVELTDAQIKALPTTPVVIVPATEVLNYSTAPTQLPIPIIAFVTFDKSAGGYTNDDANAALVIAIGSDWSLSMSCFLGITGSFIEDVQPATGVLPCPQLAPQGTLSDAIGAQSSGSGNIAGAFQDNALVIAAQNGTGNFTGGNAANTLKVTVLYTIIGI